jgi:hypothetical protein
MKLDIKHLAAYLPYNLKVSDIDTLNYGTGIGGIDHILTTKNEKYKLRLIPLSKFKDINSPEMFALNVDLHHQMELCDLANQQIGYWGISYRLAEICFANHIDIFNLIPQGLAVEKN